MAENALYQALDNYNTSIDNKYKKNWGSLLNFLGIFYLIILFRYLGLKLPHCKDGCSYNYQ